MSETERSDAKPIYEKDEEEKPTTSKGRILLMDGEVLKDF